MMRPVLLVAVKLAISAALIALVVQAFDVRGLAAQLSRVEAGAVVLAVCLMLVAAPLQAARWRITLASNGNRLPFARVLAIVLIGNFFSQVLPSSIGGDAARIWCAYRAGLTPADAAATVILDRMISLLGLLVLSLCCLPWLLALVPDAAARSAIVLVVMSGIGGFLAFVVFHRLLDRWQVARALSGFAELVRRLAFSPRLLQALAVSIAAMFVFTFVVFQLARALGAGIGYVDCLLLVPPVLLVSAIPISVAGWGVREGAMVVALGFAGVEPATAFGVSVLFGVTAAAASLPGAGLWLASGDSIGNIGRTAGLARTAGAGRLKGPV